ncbi:trypsin-like peptidase domain-containing protein [Micromonospora okii]|uniref:trypsin-like peptidase domain-containing protein n=1 Tax=Micromonospora okii TaxID=1182970 RepID=UPI001E552153|nr:trypsin-like peptidase domain-containing protein [Micromonospora okii]
MQPNGPYRFTEVMGVCQVGKAWWAVDGQDRLVTVAVLDSLVAEHPQWRQAFSGMADVLAAPGGGGRPYIGADFDAPEPWAAYAADGGPGAEHLFQALGHPIRTERSRDDSTVAMLQVPAQQAPRSTAEPSTQPTSGGPVSAQPISGGPVSAQPISGGPVSAQPASGGPVAPWALRGDPSQPASVSGPPQSVSGPPHPVSGGPRSVSAPPQPVSGAPQSVSGPPQSVSVPPRAVSAPPGFATARPVSVPPQHQPVSVPPHDPFAAPARRIQPSAPPRRRGVGALAAVAALLLVALAAGGVGIWGVTAAGSESPAPTPTVASTAFPTATPVSPGLKPWTQAALRSPEERALATVGPSLVFMEVIVTGYVRNKADGALLRKAPVILNRRCTGFVARPDGHVLTNSQCVQPTPEILLSNALSALGNALVAEGDLKQAEVAAFARARQRTTVFTGPEAGSQPESRLYGQLNVAKGDVTDTPATPGTVVRALTLEEGNVALVKLAQENLPAAELNPSATVAAETSLLVLGYGTTDTSYRSATYTVASKPVTVTGVDAQSPVNAYRIDADLGLYSRGGIAIDAGGRVVGMLDNDILRPDKANRLVVPVATMSGLLGAAGVENSLGAADKRYRSGLDAYFAGRNSAAIKELDGVVRDSPANLLAQVYRQAAVDSGGGADAAAERPGWAVPLLAVAGGAFAAGLVGLVVLLLRRRGAAA